MGCWFSLGKLHFPRDCCIFLFRFRGNDSRVHHKSHIEARARPEMYVTMSRSVRKDVDDKHLLLKWVVAVLITSHLLQIAFLIGGACGENVFLFAGPLEYALRWWILPDYANFSVVSSVGEEQWAGKASIRSLYLRTCGRSRCTTGDSCTKC